MQILYAFAVEYFLFIPEQIGPLERPVIIKRRPPEDVIDKELSLVRPGISQESTGFLECGEKPSSIEVHAAQKDRIGARFGRVHAQRTKLGENVVVNVIRLGRRLPFEVRPRG